MSYMDERTHARAQLTDCAVRVVQSLEALLAERLGLLEELQALTNPTDALESIAPIRMSVLRCSLAKVTRQQQSLLAALQSLTPPEGKPLA